MEKKPSISIGLPVYNGENFLRKRLDNILEQTYTNFELIISDNASTDKTLEICKEYLNKYRKIRYYRQKKNMGPLWNWYFVLNEAKNDYFVWFAIDDLNSKDFLEKNVQSVTSDKNLVCSMSKTKLFGITNGGFKTNLIDERFNMILKKLRKLSKVFKIEDMKGSYSKRIRSYLKVGEMNILYGVFKTDVLRKSFLHESFNGWSSAVILNALRYGDIKIIDEGLMYKFEGGISSQGLIYSSRRFNKSWYGIIFPWFPFTLWCAKNLGLKNFLRNIDLFSKINLEGAVSYLIDLLRIFLNKLAQK